MVVRLWRGHAAAADPDRRAARRRVRVPDASARRSLARAARDAEVVRAARPRRAPRCLRAVGHAADARLDATCDRTHALPDPSDGAERRRRGAPRRLHDHRPRGQPSRAGARLRDGRGRAAREARRRPRAAARRPVRTRPRAPAARRHRQRRHPGPGRRPAAARPQGRAVGRHGTMRHRQARRARSRPADPRGNVPRRGGRARLPDRPLDRAPSRRAGARRRGQAAGAHTTRYAGYEVRDEARATFERTELPRDFDTIEIPLPEKGEPELQRWDPDRAESAPPA